MKSFRMFTIIALLCASMQLFGQTDQDFFSAVGRQPDLSKALSVLNDWTTLYPTTAFASERLLQYLIVYDGLNVPTAAEFAARQLIATNALNGLYTFVCVAPDLTNPSDGLVDLVATSANKLILQSSINSQMKPQDITEELWKQNR